FVVSLPVADRLRDRPRRYAAARRVITPRVQDPGVGPALAALANEQFAGVMEADLQRAQGMGISGVPFFVFAGKYAVSGAQPVEAFGQALETSWNETAGASSGARR